MQSDPLRHHMAHRGTGAFLTPQVNRLTDEMPAFVFGPGTTGSARARARAGCSVARNPGG